MKSAIKAGLLSDLTKFIQSLSSALSKAIDALGRMDYEVKDGKKTSDGGVEFTVITGSGDEFKATITPTKTEGILRADFSTKDGKKYHLDKVKDSKDAILKAFETAAGNLFDSDAIDDAINDDTGESIFNGSNIKVTLKKVTSAKSEDIRLCAITANCKACDAMAGLDAVLSDDAFVATLTAEPTSFEIIDEGAEFDVQPIENGFGIDGAYEKILESVYALYFDAQFIHWNYSGDNFNDIHSFTNDLVWTLNSIIDYLAEIQVEKQQSVKHPLTIICELCCEPEAIPTSGVSMTCDEVISQLIEEIENVADHLECFRCNFENDIQLQFNSWIRDLHQKSRFYLPGLKGRYQPNNVIPLNRP